eukprot:COSAG02_NODE_2447_length_8839_cov_4.034211_1_plen_169_part_00
MGIIRYLDRRVDWKCHPGTIATWAEAVGVSRSATDAINAFVFGTTVDPGPSISLSHGTADTSTPEFSSIAPYGSAPLRTATAKAHGTTSAPWCYRGGRCVGYSRRRSGSLADNSLLRTSLGRIFELVQCLVRDNGQFTESENGLTRLTANMGTPSAGVYIISFWAACK